jgi:hypothetical protein
MARDARGQGTRAGEGEQPPTSARTPTRRGRSRGRAGGAATSASGGAAARRNSGGIAARAEVQRQAPDGPGSGCGSTQGVDCGGMRPGEGRCCGPP